MGRDGPPTFGDPSAGGSGRASRQASELTLAVAEERRRLAEALHDEALQHVIVARQDLFEALEGDLESLPSAAESLDEAITAIRHVTSAARLTALAGLPLAEAVDRLAADAERRGPRTVDRRVDPSADGLYDELLVATVRELLGNVVKHAAAGRASVEVAVHEHELHLTVADDGRGVVEGELRAAGDSGHVGHVRLRDQVSALGGTLEVRSTPGEGTAVGLRLPVAALEAQRRVDGLVAHERQWSAALLASIQDGLVVIRDDRIVQVNERFCELTGFTRAQLLAAPAGRLPFWPDGPSPGRAALVEALRTGAGGIDVELELQRADSTRFPALAAARVVRDDAGQPEGALVTVKDITARAQAEQRRGLARELAGARRSARALGSILEGARAVRSPEELQTLLDMIARIVCEELGWAVVVNVARPALDDLVVRATHGLGPEAEAKLVGASYPTSAFTKVLVPRFARRGAYFVPADATDVDVMDGPVYIPDIPTSDDPGAWHPMDFLVVPVTAASGRRLGLLSLDLPQSGRRPDDAELDVLVAVGAHIGVALEQVQLSEAAARRERVQAALAQLLSEMAGADAAAILPRVVEAAASTLGYARVVVDLVDPATRRLHVHASTGVADAAAALPPADAGTLDALVDDVTRRAGSRTLDRDTAERLVPTERAALRRSDANGVGELAWDDHLLVLPIVVHDERPGRLTGVMWLQDPTDRLLPNSGRLRALRAFGGIAALAVARR